MPGGRVPAGAPAMPTPLRSRTPMAFRLSDDISLTPHGCPFKGRIPTKLGFRNARFVVILDVASRQPQGFWADRSCNRFIGA
jgi:DMSO/TMAO reductase YedYZ molybdopterin-dependent catalytic subunit